MDDQHLCAPGSQRAQQIGLHPGGIGVAVNKDGPGRKQRFAPMHFAQHLGGAAKHGRAVPPPRAFGLFLHPQRGAKHRLAAPRQIAIELRELFEQRIGVHRFQTGVQQICDALHHRAVAIALVCQRFAQRRFALGGAAHPQRKSSAVAL